MVALSAWMRFIRAQERNERTARWQVGVMVKMRRF
jgi:hypothetical protein